jgi:proline racemase/trans-L-3-hydroxyproline dehydratase
LRVTTVDYHTAGEPFRIVTGGVPPIPGATILDKRRWCAENLDDVRKLLVNEPRGHADMYGCFVVEPDDDGADLGVVFFHNAGYSTACGHGTIALATWALESGVCPRTGETTELVIDVPSGRVATVSVANADNVSIGHVSFRNVPAFVAEEGLRVRTGRGEVAADVAYGGAFYACVDARAVGLSVEPKNLDAFIALGREVKRELESAHEIVHPEQPELRDVYGVIFWEDETGDPFTQRNVTIFADGEVDRSPCGSGTSARLALLDARGELPRGESLRHLSIIGSEFEGRVVGGAQVAGRPAVITEITGSAHLTGRHEFVLDERDPLGAGFLLR